MFFTKIGDMKVNKEKIIKEIARQGYTQDEFARDKLGKSRQALWQNINGTNTTIETVNEIAEALEMDPKDLLI